MQVLTLVRVVEVVLIYGCIQRQEYAGQRVCSARVDFARETVDLLENLGIHGPPNHRRIRLGRTKPRLLIAITVS